MATARPESGSGAFPVTHASLVELAAQPEAPGFRDAWERFFRAYWPPLYAWLRRAGNDRETALDLLQDFFVEGLEGRILAQYDPARGRLRAFLLGVLRMRRIQGIRRERRRRDRQRLDFLTPEAVETALAQRATDDPDRAFDEEWIRHIWTRSRALFEERLAGAKETLSLRILREWVFRTRRRSAADLAAELAITTGDLYTRATRLRQAFAQEVETRIRLYAASADEVRSERDEVLRHRAAETTPSGPENSA